MEKGNGAGAAEDDEDDGVDGEDGVAGEDRAAAPGPEAVDGLRLGSPGVGYVTEPCRAASPEHRRRKKSKSTAAAPTATAGQRADGNNNAGKLQKHSRSLGTCLSS